ncbi:hypothetical protein HYQ46_007249 [Verticillium longisporum]|nr:hypothetical protein HYQ46_007249 [Verticillium longisporum]
MCVDGLGVINLILINGTAYFFFLSPPLCRNESTATLPKRSAKHREIRRATKIHATLLGYVRTYMIPSPGQEHDATNLLVNVNRLER